MNILNILTNPKYKIYRWCGIGILSVIFIFLLAVLIRRFLRNRPPVSYKPLVFDTPIFKDVNDSYQNKETEIKEEVYKEDSLMAEKPIRGFDQAIAENPIQSPVTSPMIGVPIETPVYANEEFPEFKSAEKYFKENPPIVSPVQENPISVDHKEILSGWLRDFKKNKEKSEWNNNLQLIKGVGPSSEKRLKDIGVTYIDEMANMPPRVQRSLYRVWDLPRHVVDKFNFIENAKSAINKN